MTGRPAYSNLRAPYLYASERLLGDVYSRAKASNRSWQISGASGAIPGTGLAMSVGRSSDQPDNIYWLGEFARTNLRTFRLGETPKSGSSRHIYIRTAPLNWAILRVGETVGPVAWIYGDWTDRRSGRTVLTLCGSVENYRELRPGTRDCTTLGWYPSCPMGLASVIHAMAEGRENEIRKDMATTEPSLVSVADMAFTLTRLPRPHVLASGYVEVLAEVFTFAQNFRSPPNEKIDTFILGAPLWICPTVAEPLSTRSLPPDFETAIEEDESYYNPWQRFRRCVANWIMPSKKFLYADADELTYPELVSTPALTDLAQSWRVINDDQSDS